MKIGIGLPSMIPGVGGEQIVDWARTAEECGFSSLGVIDRLVFGNDEPLVTLGAAAAVTNRITLLTSILVVPFRGNAALVAKQAATVNHLSGGRLVLGMAVGGYEDDYDASGEPFADRGQRFDEMLAEMARIWAGESRGFAGSIGPTPGLSRNQIVFGGGGARTFSRVARWGAGWIAGSRGIETFRRGAAGVRRAWAEHGRDDRPKLMALPYFCLGSRARERAHAFLTDHYAIEGAAAERVAAGALTDASAVEAAVAEYERAVCDELVLAPCSFDTEQVRLLAEVVRSAAAGRRHG
jgi:alkanesulfonate monooxygenase SsuD/methylene tetrahydromethanopterin reductase-like flavin-dependent oxidoreductase (luciferase family)